MGLDMYLMKRKKNSEEKSEEVFYWRKANQIRQWLVNNTELDQNDNMTAISLTKEDIELLILTCTKVLTNPELAPKLLPASSGFFFGSTDYDEYYFEDIKYTIEGLIKLCSEFDWENDDLLYTEWW